MSKRNPCATMYCVVKHEDSCRTSLFRKGIYCWKEYSARSDVHVWVQRFTRIWHDKTDQASRGGSRRPSMLTLHVRVVLGDMLNS